MTLKQASLLTRTALFLGIFVVVSDPAVPRALAYVTPDSQSVPARGSQRPPQRGTRPDPQAERKTLTGASVPFPGSVDPDQVMANIKAVALQTKFGESSKIPEIASGTLRAKRVLQVRSERPPPGYLLVDVEDRAGNPMATVCITKTGVILGWQDVRNWPNNPRPLDLADVSARVTAHRGKAPTKAEYVSFVNFAEAGDSLFFPIVAATTEDGTIYFNSRGEAFVEPSSPLARELGVSAARGRGTRGLGRPNIELNSVGRW